MLDHDGDDGVNVNTFVLEGDYLDTMSPLCWVCKDEDYGGFQKAELLLQHGARVFFDGADGSPTILAPSDVTLTVELTFFDGAWYGRSRSCVA